MRLGAFSLIFLALICSTLALSPDEQISLSKAGYSSKPHSFGNQNYYILYKKLIYLLYNTDADYFSKTHDSFVDSIVYFKEKSLSAVSNLARAYKT